MSLNKRQFTILTSIINTPSLFDTHDNCFQASQREIAKELGLKSATTIDRLMAKLKADGLTNKVIDISGVERVMINPRFLWSHTKAEYFYADAMFVLGSDKAAYEWTLTCRNCGEFTDASTGEVMGPYDYTFFSGMRLGYTSFDRTKTRAKQEPKTLSLRVDDDDKVVIIERLSDADMDKIIYKVIKTLG